MAACLVFLAQPQHDVAIFTIAGSLTDDIAESQPAKAAEPAAAPVTREAKPAELPEPPAITPPPPCKDASSPPSDAIVLFDGSSLDGFVKFGGGAAGWKLNADKTMTIAPGSGSIVSKELFTDAQVHVEFATPSPATGEGQDRGNSGVYLQGRYEVQMLDSFQSKTYADGQCGALYKQYSPLVNASRAPGEWQTYDIIFRAARFDAAGKRIEKARLTVLHNGVLIHDGAELNGVTGYAPYKELPEAGPLYLQDHNCTVRYRNIWMRRLGVSR